MKIKIILFYILCFIILSCSKKQNILTWEESDSIQLSELNEPFQLFSYKSMFITSDRSTNEILLYNNNGLKLDTIGKKGQGPEEYLRISTMSVNKNGFIAVLDNKMKTITLLQILNNKITYNNRIKLNSTPLNLFIDNDNQLYLTCLDIIDDNNVEILHKYDYNLNFIGCCLSKNTSCSDFNKLKNLCCFIKKRNDIIYLSFALTGIIEKYREIDNKLQLVNKFTVCDYMIENELVIDKKRNKKIDFIGLGIGFLCNNYYIQNYEKTDKNNFHIFNAYDNSDKHIGRFKLAQNKEAVYMNFSDDFKYLRYLDDEGIIHLLKRTY